MTLQELNGIIPVNDRMNKSHLPGLDLLRVLAAILIYVQHAFSVTDNHDLNTLTNLRLGRLGTALLFAMSGYLAASTSRAPEQWLWRRLVRLYPAFWLVLAASFLGAAVTDRKSFDAWQVVCEFIGIGYFTHSIVLVTVWFFSLILVMTVVIYLAHRFGHLPVIGTAVCLIVVGSYRVELPAIDIFGFAMIYLIGYAMAVPSNAASVWVLPAVSLGTVAMLNHAGFRPQLCSIVLLALAVRPNWPTWRPATAFPPYAYEWFLSHGLCLQLVCLVTKNLWIVIPVAGILSIAVAVTLERIVHFALALIQRSRTRAGTAEAERDRDPGPTSGSRPLITLPN